MLAADRVLLLLSLVPYLRDHGETPVDELARTFDVDPKLLRRLVAFLGTAGIPGETLSYQHDDLFDIDWDLFEEHDIVALTQTVAIDEAPRFTGVETAALLAGLNALQPLLSAADGDIARALARRLADTFGAADVPSVTVADAGRDERIIDFLTAVESRRRASFNYRSVDGIESLRTIAPSNLSEREGVWYVTGHDVDRDAERMFRVDHTSGIELLSPLPEPEPELESDHELEFARDEEPAPGAPRSTPRLKGNRRSEAIIATLPVRLLPAIRGFAPETKNDLGDGRVEVSVDAWHPGAAVRLVQHGPGEIEIVSPPAARAAVSEWAEAATAVYGK